MRKILQYILLFAIANVLLASYGCTVKRDCRGHLKHRLSNGVWI